MNWLHCSPLQLIMTMTIERLPRYLPDFISDPSTRHNCNLHRSWKIKSFHPQVDNQKQQPSAVQSGWLKVSGFLFGLAAGLGSNPEPSTGKSDFRPRLHVRPNILTAVFVLGYRSAYGGRTRPMTMMGCSRRCFQQQNCESKTFSRFTRISHAFPRVPGAKVCGTSSSPGCSCPCSKSELFRALWLCVPESVRT